MREIEKVFKLFNASLEWFIGRIATRDEQMDQIRQNDGLDEREKDQILQAKKMNGIADVLEEVEVLIGMHLFNEFSETKSAFPKIVANHGAIEMVLFKRTWRTSNCSAKR